MHRSVVAIKALYGAVCVLCLLGIGLVLMHIVNDTMAIVHAFTQEYSASISATSTNSAVTFVDNGSGGSGQVFGAKSVTVINNTGSANEVYVNLRSTTATTAGIEIQPGESFTFTSSSPPDSFDGWTGIGLICANTETATVRVTAVR